MGRKVMTSTSGIVGVGKVVSKVPAYNVGLEPSEAPEAQEDEDDGSWVPAFVGGLLGVIGFISVVSCVVLSYLLVRRKMVPAEEAEVSKTQLATGDVERGLVPEGFIVDIPPNVGHA